MSIIRRLRSSRMAQYSGLSFVRTYAYTSIPREYSSNRRNLTRRSSCETMGWPTSIFRNCASTKRSCSLVVSYRRPSVTRNNIFVRLDRFSSCSWENWAFGTVTILSSYLRMRVERNPIFSTNPNSSPNRHRSPTRTGLSINKMKPPMRFSRVGRTARAMARPPTPSPASIGTTDIPNRSAPSKTTQTAITRLMILVVIFTRLALLPLRRNEGDRIMISAKMPPPAIMAQAQQNRRKAHNPISIIPSAMPIAFICSSISSSASTARIAPLKGGSRRHQCMVCSSSSLRG